MQGYCVKCRAKREMKDAKAITIKNGKPATQGVFQTCGTKMFRIGKAQAYSDMSHRPRKDWIFPVSGCPSPFILRIILNKPTLLNKSLICYLSRIIIHSFILDIPLTQIQTIVTSVKERLPELRANDTRYLSKCHEVLSMTTCAEMTLHLLWPGKKAGVPLPGRSSRTG